MKIAHSIKDNLRKKFLRFKIKGIPIISIPKLGLNVAGESGSNEHISFQGKYIRRKRINIFKSSFSKLNFKPSKLLPVIFILLVICVFALCLIYIYSHFRIKKVTVIGKKPLRNLAIFDEKLTLFINVDKVKKELIPNNPQLKDILVTVDYPDRVNLEPIYKSASAYIMDEGIRRIIDQDGQVYTDESENYSDLVEVDSTKTISFFLGGIGDWRLKKAVNIAKSLKKYGINLSRITINEESGLFRLTLIDSSFITVPYQYNEDRLGASLQIITAQFRIEGKFIRSIDFTTEKPVIVI